MTNLLVFADFHFLQRAELVGTLCYERLRGSDVYSFEFAPEWLRERGDLFLCEDLHNFPGPQFTNPDKDIFGCFSDVLPDRWGRTLLRTPFRKIILPHLPSAEVHCGGAVV